LRREEPERPEETLKVRLRSTETNPLTTFVVEVEGVIDVHYAILTSQGVQHRVFYLDINPVQQGLTSVNRREPVFFRW